MVALDCMRKPVSANIALQDVNLKLRGQKWMSHSSDLSLGIAHNSRNYDFFSFLNSEFASCKFLILIHT